MDSDKVRMNDVVDTAIKTIGFEQVLQQYNIIRDEYYRQKEQVERFIEEHKQEEKGK